MTFAMPGKQTEAKPRRTAVRIEVATDTRDVLVDRIADGIDEDDVRGKQKLIGPSGVGDPCEYCLGCQLAGLEQEKQLGWFPWTNSQSHEGLARIFKRWPDEYLVEHRVTVGEIDGQKITGSLDLFDLVRHTVVDWKLPGDRTLDHHRFSGEMKPEYFTQGHLYAKGLADEGTEVTHVAVFLLPRNATQIKKPKQLWSQGFWWAEEFKPGLAQDALDRASRIAQHIRLVGADIVLPTLEKLDGCYNCDRWITETEEDTPPW